MITFLLPQGGNSRGSTSEADLTLDLVVEGLVSWWKLSMAEPVLALKDNLLDMKTTLLSFNPKSTFYLVDGTIPEEYLGHKGKLYQCEFCGAHVNDHQNLTKTRKHCQHSVLHNDLIPKTWGRNDYRYSKPYGCPDGHGSVVPLTVLQHPLKVPALSNRQRRPSALDRLQSFSPITPSTSRARTGPTTPSSPAPVKRNTRGKQTVYKNLTDLEYSDSDSAQSD